jgi:cell wall-associated NlpC family hydrolase
VQTLREYAMSFNGLPYIWGGDDPVVGMDCSGLVQEILASVGMDPPGDQTAQGLFDHFQKTALWNKYGLGALAFYGESVSKITHVAFMLDQYRIIEAGGGGSKSTSPAAASAQNAFVRIRLIKRRPDLVAVLKPSYASIGVP